jgi:adenine/guanine phosphoribosyltransferase-like PRPP-binding protein
MYWLCSNICIKQQYHIHRDVKAGEAIFIDMEGNCHSRICHDEGISPCIFEYVYFARPDSIMDGISVYETRLKMGEKLAQKILKQTPNHDIDVVIPIPDTSRTSALQAAYTLNRPFREGFIKNRYIARTFIMPGQATRKKSVRLKLNTIKSEFAGRNVLLVDDSIVRGTTANEIVQMARDAGARKVYFSSAAPPIRFPNIYGIDIPTRHELIAYERSEEEIAKKIGCERVIYQDLSDLEDSVREAALTNPSPITKFDTSCFSGIYVTGETIGDSYFVRLHNKRNDGAMEQRKRGYDGVENAGTPAKKPAGSHDGCESVANDKRVANAQLGAGCEPLSNHQVGQTISSINSANRTPRTTLVTNLRALGFCGADDSVHPNHLVMLASNYPLVEFGILFRPDKEGQPRYATTMWVEKLAALKPRSMKLAAHLCGARVNEVLGGDSTFLEKVASWGFSRVQINATAVNGVDTSNMAGKVPFVMKVFDEFPKLEFILQKNAETRPLWQGVLDAGIPENVSMLVDESKGTGVAASSWPSPSPDYRVGYAGGIGPHNVRSVLEEINKVAANETVWIDMESSLRSFKNDKDVFDLDKCFDVIETVSQMGFPLDV